MTEPNREYEFGIGMVDWRHTAGHHPYLFLEAGEVYAMCIRGANKMRRDAYEHQRESDISWMRVYKSALHLLEGDAA